MKTKIHKKPRVNIVTLGCAKNTVDSEVLLTQLRGNRIDAVHEAEQEAPVVVINTCGFIETAKQESIDTILRYSEAKQRGVIEKIYVTGCLSQRYRENLKKAIPEVDAWFGTRDMSRLLKLLNADYQRELVGERILTNPGHFAYLKISEGCDRPCAFCAIPIMRGRHVSRPMEQLVAEAKNLAKQGVRELILIAQDSTYYGLDLYRKRTLAELLQRLSDVEALKWIRLHYAFPAGFPPDVLDVMVTRSNICNYLDIPLQHGSTHMLQKMKRGITREKTLQLLDTIREKVPGIAIRTTLMVGHPEETEEDFEHMVDLVERVKFDRLGVFRYSHEENTFSYTLKDDVPERVKKQRAEKIMRIQQTLSEQANRARIGQVMKIMVDREESGYFIGRSEFDSPEVDNEVIIKNTAHKLHPGEFVHVYIDEAHEFDLIGHPV